MLKGFKSFVSILLVMLLCGGAALAQSIYGTLLGTVTDTSGAVVPEASVVVTEQNTNVSRSGATGNGGDYQLPNLLPGTYRVSVRAPGFKEFIKTGVILDSRAIVRVDVTVEVGSTQTSVEVQAAAPVITTETASVSHVESNNVVQQLPTNYRALDTSPLNIVYTIPGINVDSGFGISIGGDNPQQNDYTVDGFTSTSVMNAGPNFEQFPSTEGVAELKVTTEVAPAEYSEMGNIEFTTKGGTNQFHGTLFEYLQNSAVDAIPDFSSGKPPFRKNDFGGSISGPVILPHYNGKNRTFFFFDYEGNRQSGLTGIVKDVPTQAMRQGNFSALCSSYSTAGLCASAGGTQLVNPLTGSPFPNNQIPQSMITSVSANVLNTFYPLPDVPNANPLDTTNNSIENGSTLFSTNLYDWRVDQNISSKQSMFFHYTYKNVPSETPLGLLQGDVDSPLYIRTYGFSHTYAIHPTLLNEFRFGYASFTNPLSYPQFPNGAQLVTTTLGIQGLGPFPGGSAIPYWEFDGASGVSSTYGQAMYNMSEWHYDFSDDLTWIRGRHTVKWGGVFQRPHYHETISDAEPDSFGQWYFNGMFTGSDFADFLLGLPDLALTTNVGPPLQEYNHGYGAYIQDSFKATPKLTLNFGLRYEYHPPYHETTNQDDNIDLAHNGAVIVPNEASLKLSLPGFEQSVNSCLLATPNPTPYGLFPCTPTVTAATYGIPSTLWFSDKKMFLPRLGLAYRLTPKTVIRAGAGMYDQVLRGEVGYSDSGNHDATFTEFPNSITNGVPLFQYPVGRPTTGAYFPAGTGIFGTAIQSHLHDPYASQWDFVVERDLGHNTGVQINYTGTRSVGLLVSPDMNQVAPQDQPFNPALQPFPNWSDIKFRTNGGSQSYNALELVMTHRFGGGLFFQSSYVYAKDLADDEGDNPMGFTDDEARIMNRFNLREDYGNVSFVPTQRWLTTFVWDLPIGRGKKFGASMNRVVDKVIGGWQTSNILILHTGPFLTPYYSGGADPSGTAPSVREGAQHPDRLPASACSSMSSSEGQLLDGSCFYYGWTGPIGRFGNSGLGILTGPSTAIWNFGLSKFFPLNERTKLQFQASATNLPNHPNFGLPAMAANAGNFGAISSLQAQEGAGARVFQFHLRLTF